MSTIASGLYPPPGGFPLIPGGEAAGVVLEVGAGVDWLKPGDRVAYAVNVGAYAEQRVVAADRVVKVPDGISDEQAAAMMLKGMTAEYLLRRTFKVKAGDTILFHAAAGGVGLILGQWAKHLGATVIGTASSADKIELAKAHGFDHVINYKEQDFVAGVAAITGGRKCDVVYDFGRQRHIPGLARLPEAARHVRQLRSVVGADPAVHACRCWRRRARCSPPGRRSSSTMPSARTSKPQPRHCSTSCSAARSRSGSTSAMR